MWPRLPSAPSTALDVLGRRRDIDSRPAAAPSPAGPNWQPVPRARHSRFLAWGRPVRWLARKARLAADDRFLLQTSPGRRLEWRQESGPASHEWAIAFVAIALVEHGRRA